VPAYASLCGDAASCGAGWTAFCCTINDGANTCPEGSFVAGWWKVDSSPFCRGEPRYIIDCNRLPSASCNCTCADDPCDSRRVCCNVFRYGQCNTQIAGVTEVVCRVVTCAPPWEWDPACSTTVRTDNRTATHTSRCLPGRDPSHIDIRYQDLGMVGSDLGAPISGERDAARGGRVRRYEHGSMYWHPGTGAHYVLGELDERYRRLGGTAGPLRYPRTDPRTTGSQGQLVRFQRGTIYRFAETGAHGVTGRSDGRYRQLDEHAGVLRRPMRSTTDSERAWRVTRFERGWIHESPAGGAAELHGLVLARYDRLGGVTGSGLGHATDPPRTSGGILQQRFERGVVVGPRDGPVHALRDRIADRYLRLGGPTGPWGLPQRDQEAVPDTRGQRADLAQATVFDSPGTWVRWLAGPVLERYLDEGGPAGALGFPTTDLFTDRAGQPRATFERGAIVADAQTLETRVLMSRTTRRSRDLPDTSENPGRRRPTRRADELP
jgi:hypothetical protein